MAISNSQKFKIRDAASYDSLTKEFDYYTEQFSLPLAEYLIELADISPLEKLLDVGTGTGVVALQAAPMINLGGMIYGIDLSEEMLKKAEGKIKDEEIEKVRFLRMDAEKLNFENEKFDVAVSLFALLHFPNPVDALNEIFRVLRPGGRLILAVGSGASFISLSGFIHIVKSFPFYFREFLGKQLIAPRFLDSLVKKHIAEINEPEESNLASQNQLTRPQTVTAVVKKAGFKILQTDWYGHRHIINSPEHFWEIQRTFSSIARKRLSIATPAEYNTIYNDFIEISRRMQLSGGTLIYPVGAFYIVAQRP